jgi:hypothetical protein
MNAMFKRAMVTVDIPTLIASIAIVGMYHALLRMRNTIGPEYAVHTVNSWVRAR